MKKEDVVLSMVKTADMMVVSVKMADVVILRFRTVVLVKMMEMEDMVVPTMVEMASIVL